MLAITSTMETISIVLREHIKDESVDLVYLDPPFNSNANYSVLFRSPQGEQSQARYVKYIITQIC